MWWWFDTLHKEEREPLKFEPSTNCTSKLTKEKGNKYDKIINLKEHSSNSMSQDRSGLHSMLEIWAKASL
jgi:hypothetical protein